MIRMIRTKTLRALTEGAELARTLHADLETAEATLQAVESRNAELARLVELLVDAVTYAFDAAEAPLDVVLHEGRVHSVHRDRQAAKHATPYGDHAILTPTPAPADDPEPLGWKIHPATPPPLPAPKGADEIEALLKRVELPAPERLAEGGRLQELTRELEAVRSQRDTAMQDTETAAAALTAQSLAFGVYRATVAEVAAEIARAANPENPLDSLTDIGFLLLKHADVLGAEGVVV